MLMANSRIFFTSDTHFGHKNIIEYYDRPFDSIEQINDFIINKSLILILKWS